MKGFKGKLFSPFTGGTRLDPLLHAASGNFMSGDMNLYFRLGAVCIPLLFITGLYCILVTHNLIRTLIGLEILTKAVTLLIIMAGYATHRMAIAQSMVITLIVIEVVVMVAAAGIILNVSRQFDSLDPRNLRNLKG